MSINFEDFKKKRRNSAEVISNIIAKNSKQKTDYTDDRMYNYIKGKDGNAEAVLRFLPSKNDTTDIVSRFEHGFQAIEGWYIENCPTTIKGKCPVC